MEIPGYKILEPLGKGGMAQVYLALQESVGRKVAIKVMNASLTPDPQFIERFIAEARCANLSHPNIITVFDAGQAGNQPYIVMEYIEGGDLAKRLRQGPLTPAQALSVIRQVAGALHTSHQKGYVH
ncbi:MAG TPA: serine/threonine-protein kinase, partial [Pseudomonadales bacterium]|nr:serine/threonine-protein kinase [Pseudomonadales bacterium]